MNFKTDKIIPTGYVTFLFTDIEDSGKLIHEQHDRISDILGNLHSIMEESIGINEGIVFKTIGDAYCCSFMNSNNAVNAAVDIQTRLCNEYRNEAGIKVRIGIHTGPAEWNGNDYMGYITLARTHRVMSSSHGGQIIISKDAYENTFIKKGTRSDQGSSEEISYRDFGERRLKDLIEPLRLFQVVAKKLPVEFPPLKTLDARANNIPVQLTSFIGREKEISDIKNKLHDSRHLTLIGTGGTGKTRLALQVGGDLIDDFENGVFISELAQVSDPFMIAETILNSLDIRTEPGQSPEDTLVNYLNKKNLLLIIDNCEHLILPAAKLIELLLKKCGGIKIIATSRAALNCEGESIYRVPSLSFPEPSKKESPEILAGYTSVRLFTERALAVNKDFRITNSNAESLAEICFKLDGIPLAIELAAARIKIMSVEKIRERLNDCFRLLTGGKRTVLQRQQTLKALIDWSYDLLSDKEKILWSRLSVFNGGWNLETAIEICKDENISEDEILDLLGMLNEKSIIIYDEVNERFRILETLKQYGEVKLSESGKFSEYRSKHLDHFHHLTEMTGKKLSGNEAAVSLEILESEHSNLISAIEWSIISNEKEKGYQIAISLTPFWNIRGHYVTGSRLMESLLDDTSGISKDSLASLYNSAGQLLRDRGIYEKTREYYDLSLKLNRELNDISGIASVLQGLGILEAGFGNFEEAHKYFKESLQMSREINFTSGIAFALNNLGNVALIRGNYEQAEMYIKESLEINRNSGNKRSVAFSLDSLGNMMTDLGKTDQAFKYLEESLEISRELGDKSGISFALNNLGGIAYRNGNPEKAQEYLEESLKIRIELNDKSSIAYTMHNLGNIYFDRGRYELALKNYKESLSIRSELGDKHGIVISLNSFAEYFINENRFPDAVKILGAAETIYRSLGLSENNKEHGKLYKMENELSGKLSEEEYIKNLEEGKRMSIEEVCRLALSWKLEVKS